jgi:hypothetical protein
MILLVCAYPLEDCINTQQLKNSIIAGGFALLTPYSDNWAHIRENVYSKLIEGKKTFTVNFLALLLF